jgi:hypothetical protein
LTPTPTNNCRINTTLNITNTGWIKYNLCNGTITYQFVSSLGSYTITDCIQAGTVAPGVPYADLAVFTITTSGTPC